MAMDAKTRQVIAFHVGDRGRESTQELWANIPVAYREQARFHTDTYWAPQGRDSGGAAPSYHETSPENQSHRTLQQHAEAASVPPGTRNVVVL